MMPIFFDLYRHAMNIDPDEAKSVCRFFRGLTFSVMSYASRTTKERASFHSIVGKTREVDFIVLEEFGETKRSHTSFKFFGA